MSLVANGSVAPAPLLPEWIDGDELWLLLAAGGITFSLRDLSARVVAEELEVDEDEDAFAADAIEIFDRTPSWPLEPAAGLALPF